jgi:outer membrane protein assembly factor BamB
MKFLLFLLCFQLMGCSLIEKWQTVNAERRTFQIRKSWVRQAPEKENLLFRKINRMTPLFYKDKSGHEFVLAGNAIDGVASYDKDSGKEQWRVKITNGAESTGTIINNRLFIGGNDGQFYSINADNGKIIWTFPTRIENLSEPLLSNGVLYFQTGNNSVYALEADSGKQLWLYTRQDPSILSVRGGSKPAIKNGTLYIGFSDGYLVALLASNGAVKWEKFLNKNKKFRDIDSNPVLDGDFLYALGFDDSLYCLRSGTGDLVWKSEKGGYGTPLLVGDRVYFASSNSEFVAVDKLTGKRIWAHQLKEGIATSASLYKGLIVFGESQGSLKFLDSGTGRLVGSFDPGKGILSPPAIDDKKNLVFFISNEANIYALEVGWNWPQGFPYLR